MAPRSRAGRLHRRLLLAWLVALGSFQNVLAALDPGAQPDLDTVAALFVGTLSSMVIFSLPIGIAAWALAAWTARRRRRAAPMPGLGPTMSLTSPSSRSRGATARR